MELTGLKREKMLPSSNFEGTRGHNAKNRYDSVLNSTYAIFIIKQI